MLTLRYRRWGIVLGREKPPHYAGFSIGAPRFAANLGPGLHSLLRRLRLHCCQEVREVFLGLRERGDLFQRHIQVPCGHLRQNGSGLGQEPLGPFDLGGFPFTLHVLATFH